MGPDLDSAPRVAPGAASSATSRAAAAGQIFGVIEGFYGRPWSRSQRLELFSRLGDSRLGTYVYGPKDDLKLRAEWRSLYDDEEASRLRELVEACNAAGLIFNYAVAPGLDIIYSDDADRRRLEDRVAQLIELGVRDFTLLFDDIPARLPAQDARSFTSFAQAQCSVANELLAFVRAGVGKSQFFFCPTEYCGRFATPNVRDSAYLNEIGELLDPEIEVFWTGPEIVSESLPSASLREVASVLRRKPLIWDNFHANDYDIRRVYLGPYAGRDAAALAETRGIITNPNCEYEANFVALASLSAFAEDPTNYEPRHAYLAALEAWRPRFALHGGGTLDPAQLELLGDLHYLPFEFGERALEVLAVARELTSSQPEAWDVQHQRLASIANEVEELFAAITHLENRELLYTLYQYVWESRTELRVLVDYLGWLRSKPAATAEFGSPALVANTYRGGLAAAIQQLVPLGERVS